MGDRNPFCNKKYFINNHESFHRQKWTSGGENTKSGKLWEDPDLFSPAIFASFCVFDSLLFS
jgi:hypothetical protein